MNTVTYGTPSLSRAKAMVGALLATLAIVGVVQVATPGSASARMHEECSSYDDAAWYWRNQGVKNLSEYFYRQYWDCMREPTPEEV